MKDASDTLYVLLRGFCESYFNTPCHSEGAAWQLVRPSGAASGMTATTTNSTGHSERSEESSRGTLQRAPTSKFFYSLKMTLNRGLATASFIVFLSLCISLLVPRCDSPLFAGDTDNTEKQTEAEKELIEQYEKQQRLYEGFKKEFDSHPVTKWKQEVDRNKKAIAVLDKQLRDMVRFENEEQIEELRLANGELQKKIETKKDEWEALKKKVDDAKERMEFLKKQLGPKRDRENNQGTAK